MTKELARKPQNIVVDVDNRLMQINWADGHNSIYDFNQLRRMCPCAECQPWKEGLGPIGEIAESARNAVGELRRVEDVTPVGGYAINFHWADGHSTGIYSFEYLRLKCPCGDAEAHDWWKDSET